MTADDAGAVPSAAAIAAAEGLLGIRYTDAERELMADNLLAQTRLALRRRAVPLPATLAPATRFDPRLPGHVPPQENAVFVSDDAPALPGDDAAIAYAPITHQGAWLRRGSLTAARLTDIYLARIAAIGPQLECFATVTADAARARAAELDQMARRGQWLGPLHGIPYGMKDIIDTAGVETAWGAEPYRGQVPAADAHVTALLHAAGAVMLGKTTVGALAYGDIWYGGRTRNPWNTEEGSSGSSAGSASATAAGLVGFSVGTETLGSIVAPSTRCGTTGLRPTFGRVSRRGAMALCPSLDKVGPICRSVEDTALVLDAMRGPDPLDPAQIMQPFGWDSARPVAGLRLGYVEADFADGHEMDRAALRAAGELGLDLVPLTRPDLPYDALVSVLFAEAAASFEALTLSDGDDALAWQAKEAWPNAFRKARFLSAVDHVQLDRFRTMVMQMMDTLFRGVDAVIGPSQTGPMLVITNFTGHPCLCLPTGLQRAHTRGPLSLARARLDLGDEKAGGEEKAGPLHDVPHTVCLWSELFHEAPALSIGQALERRFGYAALRPPVG